MAKPTTVPTWSTDTSIATGTEAGTPTKVQPSAGFIAQGLVPGDTFVGPYFNWLLNLISLWCTYLNGLATDAQFLANAFNWTGAHAFASTVQLASAPTYTTGIARQSWASMQGAWAQGGSAPIHSDDTMNISPDIGTFIAGTTRTCIPFRIPVGATLTKVTGVVFHGGAYNCTMRVVRRVNALTGSSRSSLAAGVTITAASAVQMIVTTMTFVSTEPTEIWAEFEFSNVNSSVQGVYVEWTDPGVQNQVR